MKQKKLAICCGLVGALGMSSFVEVRADVLAYPAKGQSEKQQMMDKAECQQWAKSQTGVDPQQLLGNASPPPEASHALRPRKRAKEEKQELAQEGQQQQQMKQKLDSYNHAESTCLKGRGYSIG